MNIAILTPTRQRPGKLDRLIDSVYQTASDKNTIYMYNYIDDDDPRISQYKKNEEVSYVGGHHSSKLYRVNNVYDKAQSVSKSWNVLAEKAIKNSADVIIMGNDDQVFRTNDWDIVLQKEIAKYDDDIYCCWFEDLINGKNHCAFPIVSRKWYETLGYFTPGVFHFGYMTLLKELIDVILYKKLQLNIYIFLLVKYRWTQHIIEIELKKEVIFIILIKLYLMKQQTNVNRLPINLESV